MPDIKGYPQNVAIDCEPQLNIYDHIENYSNLEARCCSLSHKS